MNIADKIIIPVEYQQVISSELAHHFRVLPSHDDDRMLYLFIDEDAEQDVKNELQIYLGKSINLIPRNSIQIEEGLYTYYRIESDDNPEATSELNQSDDFLQNIIKEAQKLKSSDIHFESFEREARIRFRIDGVLIEKYKIPSEDYLEVINKIKILSNLDITERRLPQDGRINFDSFDLRISVLPTLHGEKVVMRILGKDSASIDLNKLGFLKDQKEIYLEAIRKTNGIILISGPTGSGKTTTLYATLRLLNSIEKNIVTVEDPIEYTLEGINQVQLKENIGLTFSSTLRSFLRQDPDIIMLGEIRDSETAQMAIRASLTGHLVLSTIHTNSAVGTITRLIDMNVPPFYIADTLNLSVAQRLIRLLCEDCKKEERIIVKDFPKNIISSSVKSTHFCATGCKTCFYTGYKSRKAIYEVIPVTKDLVIELQESREHTQEKLKKQYSSISQRAFDLWQTGETSLEEVYPLLLNI